MVVPVIVILGRFEMAPSCKDGESPLSGNVDYTGDLKSAIVVQGGTQALKQL